ncbi:MAG: HAD family hydrolase, partial [Elusimicrobiota bacterium]
LRQTYVYENEEGNTCFLQCEPSTTEDAKGKTVIGISPETIKYHLDPIINGDSYDKYYDYIMPFNKRDPFDGTITNNIVLAFMTAIFGSSRRQDIGGEFAGSAKFVSEARKFLIKPETMISEAMTYGIDAALSILAVVRGLVTGEAGDNSKVHNPSEGKLGGMYEKGGMFVEVTHSLFNWIIEYWEEWIDIEQEVIEKNAKDRYGLLVNEKDMYKFVPEPVPFDYESKLREFSQIRDKKEPFNYLDEYKNIFYRNIRTLEPQQEKKGTIYEQIERLIEIASDESRLNEFNFTRELWAKVCYSALLACARTNSEIERKKIIELIKPLYYAKAASFALNALKEFEFSEEELKEIKNFREELSKNTLRNLRKINNNENLDENNDALILNIPYKKMLDFLNNGEDYFYTQAEIFANLRPVLVDRWNSEIKEPVREPIVARQQEQPLFGDEAEKGNIASDLILPVFNYVREKTEDIFVYRNRLYGLVKRDRILEKIRKGKLKDYYDGIAITVTREHVGMMKEEIEKNLGIAIPENSVVFRSDEKDLKDKVKKAREQGRMVVLLVVQRNDIKGDGSDTLNGLIELERAGFNENDNLALINAAEEKINKYPFSISSGLGNEGLSKSVNGETNIRQSLKQLTQYYNKKNKGIIVSNCDGIKAVEKRIKYGDKGIQIIGNKRLLESEEMLEKADYVITPKGWKSILDIYTSAGRLKDSAKNLEFYKDIMDASNFDRADYKIKREKSDEVWGMARDVKDSIGVEYVDTGSESIFANTGNNRLFYLLVQRMFKNENLRKLMGVKLDNGILIGENVEIGEEVYIEEGVALLGDVKILEGMLKKGTVVIDSVIRELYTYGMTLVMNVENEKVDVDNGDMLSYVFITDKNGEIKKVPVCDKIVQDIEKIGNKRLWGGYSPKELRELVNADYQRYFIQHTLKQSLNELFIERYSAPYTIDDFPYRGANIKAVAFDIDGTLAPSELEPSQKSKKEQPPITKENMRAIKKLLRNKIEVAIISGGSFERLEKQIVKDIPEELLDYLVVYSNNGSKKTWWVNGKPEYDEERFSNEQVDSIETIFTEIEPKLENSKVKLENNKGVLYTNLDRKKKKYLNDIRDSIEEKIKERGLDLPYPTMSPNHPQMPITISLKNKKHAVQDFAIITGIPEDNIAFVGDSYDKHGNDRPVLEIEGLNAVEVKVPGDTAQFIERLFPEEKDVSDQMPVQFSNQRIYTYGILDLKVSHHTKNLLLFPEVIKNIVKEPYSDTITQLIQLAYYRKLDRNERNKIYKQLISLSKENKRYENLAEFLRENYDKDTEEYIDEISEKYLTKDENFKNEILDYVEIFDNSVCSSRALRMGVERTDISYDILKGVSRDNNLISVISGVSKFKEISPQWKKKGLEELEVLLWYLRQIEGRYIEIIELPDGRIAAYDNYHLMKKAGAHTNSELEHLIKKGKFKGLMEQDADQEKLKAAIELTKGMVQGKTDEKIAKWDDKKSIYRAGKLAQDIIEIRKPKIDAIYIATMDREQALKNQLEAELEGQKIFNYNIPIIVIDDSKKAVLEKNSSMIDELSNKYGVPILHIKGQQRKEDENAYGEYLYGEYLEQLKNNKMDEKVKAILEKNELLKDGEIKEDKLKEYLAKNVFFHISGVRNYTLLQSKGQALMNVDDDAPPETYTLTNEERKKLQEERKKEKEDLMEEFIKDVNKFLSDEQKVNNEKELYELLQKHPDIDEKLEDVQEKYFSYSPSRETGLI